MSLGKIVLLCIAIILLLVPIFFGWGNNSLIRDNNTLVRDIDRKVTGLNVSALKARTWHLEWYYIGDLATLIQANGKKYLINEMNSLYKKDKDSLITILNDFMNPGEPPLFSFVRELLKIKERKRCRLYEWEEFGQRFELNIKIRKIIGNQMVLTGNTLFLPWPFPTDKNGELAEKLKRHGFDPPALLDNESDIKKSIIISNCLKYIDMLITDTDADSFRQELIEAPNADSIPKVIEDYSEDRGNRITLPRPPFLTIEVAPPMKSNKTFLSSDKEKILLYLGLEHDRPISYLNYEANNGRLGPCGPDIRPLFEKWPCGAFNAIDNLIKEGKCLDKPPKKEE